NMDLARRQTVALDKEAARFADYAAKASMSKSRLPIGLKKAEMRGPSRVHSFGRLPSGSRGLTNQLMWTDLEPGAVAMKRAEPQSQEAREQQDQTRATIESLDLTRDQLADERSRLDAAIAESMTALEGLRGELHDAETKWDEHRGLLDSWKDRHNALEIQRT